MNVLSYLQSLAGKFLRPSQTEEDMEEELRSHIQYRADDLERGGLDRGEAERRACIEFGGHARFREECRDALGARLLDSVFHDVRFSLRLLRKSPGFTIAAVLTLAFAIGANAVVFGVLNGLVLRPLNVPQPESLWGTEYGSDPGWQSYPNYVDLRDRNRSFEDLAAFNFAFVGLDSGNDPVRASGYAVTGNYFDVLRIQPYLGRFFHRADEHGPNSVPYIVLSHPYWHSHFQDDRGVLGRVVLLNKHPYTVIGVAPPEFRGTLMFASVDFFMPLVDQEQVDGVSLNSRGNIHAIFEVLGHLKPGVTPAQAVADMNAVGADLTKAYPKEFAQKTSSLSREGLTSFGAPVKAFVGALMLLACLILLAACANLGSLFAARAADRSREVALRIALGSTRNRVLRGLFTEAVLISLMGGALGLWASIMLLGKLSVWQPFPTAPIRIPVHPDTRVYIVALLLALVSGLLFGVVPVRQVLRTDPYEIIKAASIAPGKRRISIRDLLLTLQIAICGVLVTSSMVAVRGLARSLYSSLGFEARNATIVDLNLAMAGYSNDQAPALQKRILDSLRAIPGVESVGLSTRYPPLIYAAAVRENVFRNETNDLTVSNVAVRPYRYDISPGYFEAAKTSLLTGRDFTWHDDKNAPAVGVVNRDFAVRLFGSVDAALGGFYKLQDGTRVQVVGIVEDGKYMSLTEDQQPAIFLSYLRSPTSECALIVRSSRDPRQLASAIRSSIRELEAGLPVDSQSWSAMLNVVLFPSRVATVSLGVLGIMGAMLSVTGVFGMAAYAVSRRLKDLGIRLAVGAQPHQLLQAALGRAFRLLACGSCTGLLLGIAASRILSAIVYQATPRDPLVLSGVVLTMLLIGLLATWIPAQRVLSINPLALLREE
jgi:predicted permease